MSSIGAMMSKELPPEKERSKKRNRGKGARWLGEREVEILLKEERKGNSKGTPVKQLAQKEQREGSRRKYGD